MSAPRVALVTGAGRMGSIGHAVALRLATDGFAVALTGTDRPDARSEEEKAAHWSGVRSVVDQVRRLGSSGASFDCDVRDPQQVEVFVAQVADELGEVGVVVNSAAAPRGPDRVPAVEMDAAVWRLVVDVNLTGTFNVSVAAARHMLEHGRGGSIVNISSIAGKSMGPNLSAYAASKAGVQALTSSMSYELAPQGIRVNAVCPGVVATSRLDDVRGDEAAWLELCERIPIGRPGHPRDIAGVVAFLCGDDAEWISGQSLNVDGGRFTSR